jgi:hypothetical protein
MTAKFVNDTTAMYVERWGGYLPCSSQEDCTLLNEVPFEIMSMCKQISSGPIQGQSYCQCDSGLYGPDCTKISEAGVLRAVVFGVSALLAVSVLPLAMNEILARSNPVKWNPMFVSLLMVLPGGVLNFLWGALGLYFIIAAAGKPGFTGVRIFFMYVVIPGTLAFAFATTMIISLAWRQVVIDSNFNRDVDKDAVVKKERRVKHVVVATCVFMLLAVGLALWLASIPAASLVLFVCDLCGLIFFYRSGKRFHENMSSTFKQEPNPDDEKKNGISAAQLSMQAAGDANRAATKGMAIVVLSSMFLIFTQPFIVSQTICVGGASVGIVVSQCAIVAYSRQVRMIRVNLRKKKNAPSSAATAALFSSSGTCMTSGDVSITSNAADGHGNKVSPS